MRRWLMKIEFRSQNFTVHFAHCPLSIYHDEYFLRYLIVSFLIFPLRKILQLGLAHTRSFRSLRWCRKTQKTKESTLSFCLLSVVARPQTTTGFSDLNPWSSALFTRRPPPVSSLLIEAFTK